MRFPTLPTPVLGLLLLASRHVVALDLDLTSDASIRSVAGTIAFDMMSYYKGNLSGQIPGQLPGPPPAPAVTNAGYFWWEAGGMWGTMIEYWYYTGDSTYNDVALQGLQFQTGDKNDYLPQNQTNGMGNDDQGFWGMSAMTAAELNFTNPGAGRPGWLALAQAVYNTQVAKIDNVCGGGLRWQAYSFLNGYDYKNSIANGCLFNIATRLARYTGNTTYQDTANRIFDWERNIGLISPEYNVYDGTDSKQTNCTIINKQQFSYNAGIYLHGAATMYNITTGATQAQWQAHVEGLLTSIISVFFPNGIGFEVACEAALVHCTIDMLSLKAYLVRWMAATTKLAPFTHDRIIAVLQSSAKAAVQQCIGSPADHPNGRMCGMSWSKLGDWDGTAGVGQQMAALQVVQSHLIPGAKSPLTSGTGGTSAGDPNAGTGTQSGDPTTKGKVTTADKAGAGFLTAFVAVAIVGGLGWLSLPDGHVR